VATKTRVCGRSIAGVVGSIAAGSWISVCCECCVLSGRGLYVGLIILTNVVCVIVKPRQRKPLPEYVPKRHRRKRERVCV
jgi:hypothetical protein